MSTKPPTTGRTIETTLTLWRRKNMMQLVLPLADSMPPAKRAITRLSDTVAADLETRILEGSLRPGDRLPAERELAVELGISRPSLREAIQKLVAKGLLASRQGGGTYVTDRLEAPFVDPWQGMLDDHPAIQTDMLEFRHMLESQAAFFAAERATDADIARLDAAFEELTRHYQANDLPAGIKADVTFHQVVAECSHNVMIGHLTASLLRVIHGHISRNIEQLHGRPSRWIQLQSQHQAIWRGIRDHQPEQAAAAARRHIEFVQQNILDSAKEVARLHSAKRRLGDGGT